MVTTIVVWASLGLGAGVLVCLDRPGRGWKGWTGTVLLGIAGALLGAGLARLLGNDPSPARAVAWILPSIGAVVLLLSGPALRRSLFGPARGDLAPRVVYDTRYGRR